jgi:hypothetical protein
MFKKQTVFVLGAGASWHYGYPTGEALIEDVLSCTVRYRNYCKARVDAQMNMHDKPLILGGTSDVHSPQKSIQKFHDAIAEADDLANRLRSVQPIVIDYFLGWNAPLHDLGRMMIAAALLERESHHAGRINYNRFLDAKRSGAAVVRGSFPFDQYNDNWIRFVVHQLMLGCTTSKELLNNRVRFITFNYDTSFEKNLRRALSSINLLEREDIEAFLAEGRITHMYGQLADTGSSSASSYKALDAKFTREGDVVNDIRVSNQLIDQWYAAAADLRVIDPLNKRNDAVSKRVAKILAVAKSIYFLGFGFDQNNVERLGFPMDGRDDYPRIFYTNYGDALSINKRVAQIFSAPEIIDKRLDVTGRITVEKSIRDTYSAISYDFGGLAE